MRTTIALTLVFAVSTLGCGGLDPNGSGTGGSGNGAQGGGSGGGTGGGGGGGSGGGVPDPGCGKQTFALGATLSTPNVMLVVDESGSMQEQVPGTNLSKWETLQGSVKQLLTNFGGKANWGLSIFPHPNGSSCDPGQVDLPVGPNNANTIISQLDGLNVKDIGGSTPTESTLQAIMKSGALHDPSHPNYVLLMTDGLPTCNQDGKVTPVIQQMYQSTPSIRTFVVGLGDGTQSDPGQLNDWADAGHTARMGAATKYYQANNANDLTMAFDQIVSGVASCTYTLASKPDDPSLLVGYIDGQAVPNDPVNGYTYDAGSTSITFHGTSCDKIKAGGATKVDIIYGCPSPPIQ